MADRPTTHDRRLADWTVLAYLAGDNDLEGVLLKDLNEMERVGSRPGQVEILAQIDRGRHHSTSDGNWQGSRRYYVTRGTDPRRIQSRLLADLGETNTGDPRVLQDFIAFGATQYPARQCALVIGNHGSGVWDPPDLRATRPSRALVDGPAPHQPDGDEHTSAARRRPFFSPSRARLRADTPRSRGIAFDDGAGDYLDTLELEEVLASAHRRLGRPLDLVGMDACLMTMLEVVYEIREHARVLVGSEEVEPGAGWPHDTILGDLVKRPAMTGADLGRTIVARYAEWCRAHRDEGTQSALDLTRLDALAEAVDALAGALLARLRSLRVSGALVEARRRTLRFFDGLYVDLHHFCGNLAAVVGERMVAGACAEVQHAIEGRNAPGPIIAGATVGARLGRARGISIYLPAALESSTTYRELAFARRTRWADLLEAVGS